MGTPVESKVDLFTGRFYTTVRDCDDWTVFDKSENKVLSGSLPQGVELQFIYSLDSQTPREQAKFKIQNGKYAGQFAFIGAWNIKPGLLVTTYG